TLIQQVEIGAMAAQLPAGVAHDPEARVVAGDIAEFLVGQLAGKTEPVADHVFDGNVVTGMQGALDLGDAHVLAKLMAPFVEMAELDAEADARPGVGAITGADAIVLW